MCWATASLLDGSGWLEMSALTAAAPRREHGVKAHADAGAVAVAVAQRLSSWVSEWHTFGVGAPCSGTSRMGPAEPQTR
jgi:hypothetical protein